MTSPSAKELDNLRSGRHERASFIDAIFDALCDESLKNLLGYTDDPTKP